MPEWWARRYLQHSNDWSYSETTMTFYKRQTSNKIQNFRITTGNDRCCDCGAPSPQWVCLIHGCMTSSREWALTIAGNRHLLNSRSSFVYNAPEHTVDSESTSLSSGVSLWTHSRALKSKGCSPAATRHGKTFSTPIPAVNHLMIGSPMIIPPSHFKIMSIGDLQPIY